MRIAADTSDTCAARAAPTRQSAVQSSGFTIFELLIVIAILVAVSAMAAPQLMSMMRESAIYEAADDVRETMGEARRFAVETGIDYEFRYELGGPTVVVLPSQLEDAVNEQSGTSNTVEQYVRIRLELPEDVSIRGDDSTVEVSERLEPEVFGQLGGTQLSQKSWSGPVLFRFDGTSDDAELKVTGADNLTVKVTLRGLTGTARTGQVYVEED